MKPLRSIIKKIQRIVGTRPDGIFGPVSAWAVLQYIRMRDDESLPRVAERTEFDARTERNLATLTPAAQKVFRVFIAKAKATAATMGCEYVAIGGTRSWEEQDKLYAKGRNGVPGPAVTNARGGYSNHNFGIALDFGVFRSGKYLEDSREAEDRGLANRVHRACAVHAAECGLVWGGAWHKFQDPPHYQMKTEMSLAEMREAVKNGKEVF